MSKIKQKSQVKQLINREGEIKLDLQYVEDGNTLRGQSQPPRVLRNLNITALVCMVR